VPGSREREDEEGRLPEALRAAVERTFAATSGSAADTRERAAGLLDEVARRGAEAREAVEGAGRAVVRRGQDAGETPRALVTRLLDRVRGAGRGGEAELAALRREVEVLRRRVAELEGGGAGGRPKGSKSKSKPKG
jgi:polyhydroxyalkanoate synthesis regulator phasin